MLNVFCLWVGNKYSFEYVEKLKNMVSRNLEMEHQFICLTDKPNMHKAEGIKFEKAVYCIPDSWCKLSMFHPQIQQLGYEGKSLYLDLDIVIIDKIDSLVQFNKDFTIIEDWVRPTYNSSVMIWEIGKKDYLAMNFRREHMGEHKGDQDLITKLVNEKEKSNVKTFKPKPIVSYKFSGAKTKDIDKLKKEKCKIVVFHGKPKPHELLEIKGHWVKEYWK